MYKRLLIIVCLAVSGCVSQNTDPLQQYYYLKPETNLTQLGPTLFLQLENKTQFDRIASDATDALFQSLQQNGLLGMTLLDPEDSKWQELNLGSFNEYTLQQLDAIRNSFSCNSILYGSVTRFTPYPHLSVGLHLNLMDLNSGETVWALKYIWDSSDNEIYDRVETYYTQRNLIGLPETKDRLGNVSSIKFMKFIAHEVGQTLSPKI